jgi:hypothetical protein
MKWRYLFLALLVCVSSACGSSGYHAQAAPTVASFIQYYNQGDFAAAAGLFRNGNPLIKPENDIPLEQLEAYLARIHRTFGKAVKLDDAGAKLALDTERGREYVLVKAGTFQNGAGSMDFTFTIVESGLHLRYVGFGGPLAEQSMQSIALLRESAAQSILGKWRHISLVRVVDGRALPPQQFDGQTIAEFRADGTWSANGPKTRSAGTYRWLEPGLLETTTVESNLAIQPGGVMLRRISVDAERLTMTITQRKEDIAKSLPAENPDERRPEEITVTTTFSRVVP